MCVSADYLEGQGFRVLGQAVSRPTDRFMSLQSSLMAWIAGVAVYKAVWTSLESGNLAIMQAS